jgi:hypothetical protein
MLLLLMLCSGRRRRLATAWRTPQGPWSARLGPAGPHVSVRAMTSARAAAGARAARAREGRGAARARARRAAARGLALLPDAWVRGAVGPRCDGGAGVGCSRECRADSQPAVRGAHGVKWRLCQRGGRAAMEALLARAGAAELASPEVGQGRRGSAATMGGASH